MVCYSEFLSLWQNTWENKLEGGKIYFAQFQRFQSMIGLDLREADYCDCKVVYLMVDRKQRGPGDKSVPF
jgi:hypothetical protein